MKKMPRIVPNPGLHVKLNELKDGRDLKYLISVGTTSSKRSRLGLGTLKLSTEKSLR